MVSGEVFPWKPAGFCSIGSMHSAGPRKWSLGKKTRWWSAKSGWSTVVSMLQTGMDLWWLTSQADSCWFKIQVHNHQVTVATLLIDILPISGPTYLCTTRKIQALFTHKTSRGPHFQEVPPCASAGHGDSLGMCQLWMIRAKRDVMDYLRSLHSNKSYCYIFWCHFWHFLI